MLVAFYLFSDLRFEAFNAEALEDVERVGCLSGGRLEAVAEGGDAREGGQHRQPKVALVKRDLLELAAQHRGHHHVQVQHHQQSSRHDRHQHVQAEAAVDLVGQRAQLAVQPTQVADAPLQRRRRRSLPEGGVLFYRRNFLSKDKNLKIRHSFYFSDISYSLKILTIPVYQRLVGEKVIKKIFNRLLFY